MLRVDKKVPRVGLRRTGLILMLAIVPVAVVFVRAGYSLDRYRVATDRAIIRLAETDFEAMSEIQRRLDAGEFSTARLREIGQRAAAIILAIPQDRVNPSTVHHLPFPHAMWGSIYIALLDMNIITKEEARRLFDDIITLSIDFPRHNREGDPLFFLIVFHGHSVGAESLMPMGVYFDLADARIDAQEIDRSSISGPSRILTPDYQSLNLADTLAISWLFEVGSHEYVFSDKHTGIRTVSLTGALRTDGSSKTSFARDLLDRAYGGSRQYELVRELVIQPEGDGEASRWSESISDIIDQYGTFQLGPVGQINDLFVLRLSIDKRLAIPDDSAVVVRAVVRSRPDGQMFDDWYYLVITSNQRTAGVPLLFKTEEITQSGGVWVELQSVTPYPRDQLWRPLVITGDLEPIWVPLETPKP